MRKQIEAPEGEGGPTGHCPAWAPGNGQGWVPIWVNGPWGSSRGGPESQHLAVTWSGSRSPSLSLLPQSRDRKMVGDVVGAQSYASTAKCLNIWALVLGIFLTIGSIVLLVFVYLKAYQMGLQMANNGGY